MRTKYRASFKLESRCGSDEPLSMEEVAEVCLDWVFDRSGLVEPTALQSDVLATIEKQEIGKGATLESRRVVTSEDELWGASFELVDTRESRLVWVTDQSVVRSKANGQILYTCVNRLGSVDDSLLRFRRRTSRPRVIERLLKRFDGSAGYPLQMAPFMLKDTGIDAFVGVLKSPERTRPVVFVSAANADDKPKIDQRRLASLMGGLAHVHVGANRFPSLSLARVMPQRLNCWDGAVRIYWPGFQFTDSPYSHELWSRHQIRKMESGGGDFCQHLFENVVRVAVTSAPDTAVTWADIGRAHRSQLHSDLREAGEISQLVEVVEQENADLKAINDDLLRQLKEALEKADAAGRKAIAWREALEHERRGGAASMEDRTQVPFDSVSAAVERAMTDFSDQLVFALNTHTEIESNPFQAPEELFLALEWVAKVYVEAKRGDQECQDLDRSCREFCGWNYEPHQNKATMKKYPSWYTTKHNGRQFDLPTHLKTGSSTDARHTIRLAFTYDLQKKKAIIGFIGQHQKTRASN